MTVIDVTKDVRARTLTIVARFDAPIDRVWRVWSDPRQLERWWGPPGYPAQVLAHDLRPGGSIRYVMTGPDGQRHGGWFRVRAADPPRSLELDAGFADADGIPIPDGHTAVISAALAEVADGVTQMTVTSTWASNEAMEQALATGMEAGLAAGVGQIDALLGSPTTNDRTEVDA